MKLSGEDFCLLSSKVNEIEAIGLQNVRICIFKRTGMMLGIA